MKSNNLLQDNFRDRPQETHRQGYFFEKNGNLSARNLRGVLRVLHGLRVVAEIPVEPAALRIKR